jgi:hypothetical protein
MNVQKLVIIFELPMSFRRATPVTTTASIPLTKSNANYYNNEMYAPAFRTASQIPYDYGYAHAPMTSMEADYYGVPYTAAQGEIVSGVPNTALKWRDLRDYVCPDYWGNIHIPGIDKSYTEYPFGLAGKTATILGGAAAAQMAQKYVHDKVMA